MVPESVQAGVYLYFQFGSLTTRETVRLLLVLGGRVCLPAWVPVRTHACICLCFSLVLRINVCGGWCPGLPNLLFYCIFSSLFAPPCQALLSLLENVLEEPIYHQLRTVDQLGYSVGWRDCLRCFRLVWLLCLFA